MAITTHNQNLNSALETESRALPCNPEAERVILGTILLNSALLNELLQAPFNLTADAFYVPLHAHTFDAMIALHNRNDDVNAILIGEILKSKGLNTSGAFSPATIANLAYGLPHTNSLAHYARLVLEKQTARTAIKFANELSVRLLAEDETPLTAIAEALDKLNLLIESGQAGRKPTVNLGEAMPDYANRLHKMASGEILTVSTGLHQIDSQLTGNGFEKRMIHVIGARPGAGKTSFALDVAGFNAACGNLVVLFCLELSREVILDRLLSPFAAIPRWQIAAPFLSQPEIGAKMIERLLKTGEILQDFPLYINDRARTPAEMRAACRQIVREAGRSIDLILIDYIQRCDFARGVLNQHQGVSLLMKELATLAPEFGAAVVPLSQLSRESESRVSDEPKMTDFRESGSIEEYARTAAILCKLDDGKPHRSVRASFLKQGEGDTFIADLVYTTPYMTFGGRDPLFAELNDRYSAENI